MDTINDRIVLTKDGDAFCALLGADPMEGRMGCGSTPAEAIRQLALEIELYGWTFESGIKQEGRIPRLRLRFHPGHNARVREVVAQLSFAIELVPDLNQTEESIEIESRRNDGIKVLGVRLEDLSLENLRAA